MAYQNAQSLDVLQSLAAANRESVTFLAAQLLEKGANSGDIKTELADHMESLKQAAEVGKLNEISNHLREVVLLILHADAQHSVQLACLLLQSVDQLAECGEASEQEIYEQLKPLLQEFKESLDLSIGIEEEEEEFLRLVSSGDFPPDNLAEIDLLLAQEPTENINALYTVNAVPVEQDPFPFELDDEDSRAIDDAFDPCDEMDPFDLFADSASDNFSTEVGVLAYFAVELHELHEQLAEHAQAMAAADNDKLIIHKAAYSNLVKRILSTSEACDLTGVVFVCKQILHNLEAAQYIDESLAALLCGWSLLIESHLRAPDDDSLCLAIADFLEQESWPQPLAYRQLRDLLRGLTHSAEVSGDIAANQREKIAHDEDIALDISDDANEQLISAFLTEAPEHAEQLTMLIQQLASENGEALSRSIAAAQRVAHTLKGSAHLLGIKGMGNIAHHLEDIFEWLDIKALAPAPALRATLEEAGDCIETMLDYLLGNADAPTNSQTVLQQLIDWALLADAGEIDALTGDGSVASKPPENNEPDPNFPIESIEKTIDGDEVTLPFENGIAEPSVLDPFAEEDAPLAPLPIDVSDIDSVDSETALSPKPIANHSTLPMPGVASREAEAKPAPAAVKDEAEKSTTDGAAQSDSIRVSRTLLDNIFNLVGETSIALGQMQERLRRLGLSSREILNQEQAIQARRFELENAVSVKGLSMKQARIQTTSDFDSLEMDHYDEFYGVAHSFIEVVNDSRVAMHDLNGDVRSLQGLAVGQQRLNSELQDLVLATRLELVKSLSNRLQRCVRQACRMANKDIELIIKGEQLMMDGDTLKQLADPLMHILRNAVDHGIEDAATREKLGKPQSGTIELHFRQQGNHIVVSCQDDGRGLDFSAIRRKAIERGFLQEADVADDHTLSRFVLRAGFSTRETTSQLSGRGVGMDVVHTAILNMKGILDIGNATGGGAKIELNLPVTLLTNHSLLVAAGKRRFAIPSNRLEQILSPGLGSIVQIAGKTCFQLGEELYPFMSLASLVGVVGPEENNLLQSTILIVKGDTSAVAVAIEQAIASNELVMKSVGDYLSHLTSISGMSLLGDGSLVPVLNVPQLIAEYQGDHVPALHENDMATAVDTLAKIMIVDDSLSVRNSLAQLVSDSGYQPLLARDGVEALSLLEHETPALVLTDLEMPRMTGLELAHHIRHSEQPQLPIIMITSRTLQKHREQADKAGVNAYLTKPFSEEALQGCIAQYMEVQH